MRDRRFLWLLVPLLAGPLLWLLVSPAGNFPVNDEWSYAFAVRRLAETGVLRLCPHASLPGLPPILAAALLAKVFGFSYTLLRATSVGWGVLGALFLFLTLRDRGVERGRAGLAAGLLFFNPVYLYLCFTFHMDVAFAALLSGALFCFMRGEDRASSRWDLAAGLLAAAATVTRQPGIVFFVGAALLRFPCGPRRYAPLFSPLLLVAAVYGWIYGVHGETWAMAALVGKEAGRGLFSFAGLHQAGLWLISMGLYACLFSLPLFLPIRIRRPRRTALFLAAGMVLALGLGPWPLFPNVIHPLGLGPLTGAAAELWKPARAAWSSPWTWMLLSLAAGLTLGFVLGETPPWNRDARRISGATLPPAYPFMSRAVFFDRYLAAPLGAFTALFALHRRDRTPPPAAWFLLLLLAAASIIGLRDYFAWNRAKWALGEKAMALGFKPEEVANGIDWAARWTYESRMDALMKAKPLSEIGEMEWRAGPFPRAVISFDPAFYPLNRLAAVQRYRSPLAPPTAALFLYRTNDPSSAPSGHLLPRGEGKYFPSPLGRGQGEGNREPQ